MAKQFSSPYVIKHGSGSNFRCQGECVISSVLSHHNKNLKRWTSLTALGQIVSQLSDRSVLQLRVTAQFNLENEGKYILKALGHADPKDVKKRGRALPCNRVCERESAHVGKSRRERERDPWPFGSSFYMFFPPPLGLPYVNMASQECCLFYLRSSLQSSDLLFFYFGGLFPSLSFSHCHSGLFFSYSH